MTILASIVRNLYQKSLFSLQRRDEFSFFFGNDTIFFKIFKMYMYFYYIDI